jgi:hypothetical protein
VVNCPTCRGPMTAAAPPAVEPESPFGELESGVEDSRPSRFERNRGRQVSGVRTVVWGFALVPILLIVGLVLALLFRVIPGGITDLGIVAAAALVVIIVAIAFALDRMLGG